MTWLIAHHNFVLYGIGGLAVLLVGLSLWGLLRGMLRNRSRRPHGGAEMAPNGEGVPL